MPDINEAVSKFLYDLEHGQKRKTATLQKHRNLLEKRLLPWCERRRCHLLKQLDVDAVREFRSEWPDSPLTAQKNLERLRAFFWFCHGADWVKNNPGLHNKPKIAMYCTGGIRCEKATAFMKEQGFEDVFHLKGGILKYLEEVPEEESLWEGACFVFDERVSVVHGLAEGDHQLCHACRNPITEEVRLSPLFEEGVSCPSCYNDRTEEDRQRFRDRQKQIDIAKKRGEKHLGR